MLSRHAQIAQGHPLVQAFLTVPRGHDVTALDTWFAGTTHCGITDLATFAQGLERESAGLEHALLTSWSNGPTEETVNKIKVLKRQTYGRASDDLLRRRVLLDSSHVCVALGVRESPD